MLYHPAVNADLPFLRKKNTEMILASRMCWAQKMPCIYPAVRVWIGSGFKTENRQSIRDSFQLQHQTFQSTSHDIQMWLFPPLRWKTVHSRQSVKRFADIKWRFINKIHKYILQSDGLPFLHLYPQKVQLSCKYKWLILIQRTAAFYGAGKLHEILCYSNLKQLNILF